MSSVIILQDDLRKLEHRIMQEMIQDAQTKPKIVERHAGTVGLMVKPRCEYAKSFLASQQNFGIGDAARDWMFASIFEDGEHFILNDRGDLVSTYAVAMQKIASCERTVEIGSAHYSGISPKFDKTENGFTRYPGAVCHQFCSDDRHFFTAEEIGDTKVGDLIPMFEIYCVVSGGTGTDDLESALAPRNTIIRFAKEKRCAIHGLGVPPISSKIITARLLSK